jgi:hypothetical protein
MVQQVGLARARLTADDDELRVRGLRGTQRCVEAGQLVVTAHEVAHFVSLMCCTSKHVRPESKEADKASVRSGTTRLTARVEDIRTGFTEEKEVIMATIATRDGVRAENVVVPLPDTDPHEARLSFDNGLERVTLGAGADSDALLTAEFGEELKQAVEKDRRLFS